MEATWIAPLAKAAGRRMFMPAPLTMCIAYEKDSGDRR